MKLIIAGSRTLNPGTDYILYTMGLFMNHIEITEIISGGAKGIDTTGEFAARECLIPVKLFLADWDTYGKSAGHIRNKQMADYGDALLLIWDGESKGSANMKENMLKLNKPVYEVIIKAYNKPKVKNEEEGFDPWLSY